MQTAQRIRLELENEIVDGRLLPGAKLDPEELATRYGCSRTPVREALQALEASGLLRVQSKRGTFVTELSAEELMERFEVMAEIEALCAALACRRALPDSIARIERAMQGCEAAAARGDLDAYYAENTEFHRAIYAASGNHFLAAEAGRLQAILQPYRRRQLGAPGRMQRSLDEHRRIFEAIRSGQEPSARQTMHDHVLVQGERFRDLLAILGNLKA
ncbi:FCD domain-containing protein [Salipiger mangrovisoli]|uniref:GntR family transcriptional regulator n=1 Tax=Salipiger mangrovisoli TaxID=2865933 RepID=A0ABR9X7R6_9RHOB|nr:GntR family transcriptional regulator [Salipiger mangrovisoli]